MGEYPTLSLSGARQLRSEARELVKKGIHPAKHRKAAQLVQQTQNATTFEAVTREWLGSKAPTWTPGYARQVQRFLEVEVFPELGTLPIRSVEPAHLLTVMRRLEQRGAATVATLIRQWCSAIFRYAVATLRADTDPAAFLKGAVTRPKTKHHRPLNEEQIAEFTAALSTYKGHPTTRIALRLMLLTFVRTKELREATWSEIDLDRADWRIPANRMKMGQAHIVPLSSQAVTSLRELQTYTGDQGFLFPNNRRSNACMTATTLNRALERMGFNGKGTIGFSAHGFRATASTILNEQGHRPDIIERQLAHTERNKVRASYNQAEYLNERRTMMQDWADYIDRISIRTSKDTRK